jgi:serine/threonine-protein kinase
LRGEPVTGASDQYALACAVYHTVAGAPPYERETRAKLYGAHLLATPPTLSGEDPNIAEVTSDAVERAMAKDPASRFPSCGAMIHEALPAGQDAPAITNGARLRQRSPRPDPRRRSLALLTLFVVFAAGAFWALVRMV